MRIQNLKAPPQPVTAQTTTPEAENPLGDNVVAHKDMAATGEASNGSASDRQTLEIEFLKARIQHLELVVETARGLMGSNHERLLRRLQEVPRKLVDLSNRLRRFDPQTTW